MRVIIAEKPSMGMDIAKALGGHMTRRDGYVEVGDNDIVTWAVGHLLGQAMPEAYGEKYKIWSMDDLPIIPTNWIMEPNEKTKAQLKVVGKLIKQASMVVNAGDSAREGQLIIDELLDYFKYKGPAKRLWLQESNTAAIRKALAAMKDNKSYERIYISGLCRSRADYIIGLSGTRLYTMGWRRIHSDKNVFHVGRVQTPTLSFVVERDLEIKNFKPEDYFIVKATVDHPNGQFPAKWEPSKDESWVDDQGRCRSKQEADRVKAKVSGKAGVIAKCETNHKKQGQPLTFSLGDLQKACHRIYGLSPADTLKIAQSLYETHKVTSYPRTDFGHLPEDEHGMSQGFLDAAKDNLGSLWDFPGKPDFSIKSKAFNTSKIGDHHGIRPTAVKGVDVNKFTRMELAVYKLIVRQFLAQFYPEYEYNSTQVEFECEQELFKASGTQPLITGWKVLFQGEEKEDQEPKLPIMSQSDSAAASQVDIEDKKTTPPPRYNAASLLDVMEKAWKFVTDEKVKKFVRDAGIGTPATRSSIIDALLKRGYMIEVGKGKSKHYEATEKGILLYQVVPPELRRPDLTAYFEQILKDIEEGKSERDLFEKRVEQFINKLVNDVKSGKIDDQLKAVAPSSIISGANTGAGAKGKAKKCKCGADMRLIKGKNGEFWGCTTFPACKNTVEKSKTVTKLSAKGSSVSPRKSTGSKSGTGKKSSSNSRKSSAYESLL